MIDLSMGVQRSLLPRRAETFDVMLFDLGPATMDGLEVILYLQRQRHAVYIARNEPEALHVAARHPLHFAFVDVDPPAIDGYEVARKLRSLHGGDHLTLVAVTGRGRPSAEDRRAYHAGFDLQLERPFRCDEVDMVLRSPRVRSIRDG